MATVTVPISIADELIEEALCSGLDGIAYWGYYEDDVPEGLRPSEAVMAGHVLIIRDTLDDQSFWALTREHVITRGLPLLATLAPQRFAELMAQNADAVVGDLLIQYSLFGELRYG